jgi:hypothetical protein
MVYVPFAKVVGQVVLVPVSVVPVSVLVLVSEPDPESVFVTPESSPLDDEHATAKTTAVNEPRTKPKLRSFMKNPPGFRKSAASNSAAAKPHDSASTQKV